MLGGGSKTESASANTRTTTQARYDSYRGRHQYNANINIGGAGTGNTAQSGAAGDWDMPRIMKYGVYGVALYVAWNSFKG